MYLTFIKLLVSLSLLVCCGFVGRVLYSRVVQGKDPRHIVEAGARGAVGDDEALCGAGMKFFSFRSTMLPISVARCAGFAEGASLRSPS